MHCKPHGCEHFLIYASLLRLNDRKWHKLIAVSQTSETINFSHHKSGGELSTENNLLLIFPLIAFPEKEVLCFLAELLHQNDSLESTVSGKSEAHLKEVKGLSLFTLLSARQVLSASKDQARHTCCPLSGPPCTAQRRKADSIRCLTSWR